MMAQDLDRVIESSDAAQVNDLLEIQEPGRKRCEKSGNDRGERRSLVFRTDAGKNRGLSDSVRMRSTDF
jgi:hypothetical protein